MNLSITETIQYNYADAYRIMVEINVSVCTDDACTSIMTTIERAALYSPATDDLINGLRKYCRQINNEKIKELGK